MNPLSQLNNAIDGASGEAAKEAAHEVKSVLLASADERRQRSQAAYERYVQLTPRFFPRMGQGSTAG